MKKSLFQYKKIVLLMLFVCVLMHSNSIFASGKDTPDKEGADTKEAAIKVKANHFMLGRIDNIDDVDYYKFTTDDKSEYVLYDTSDKEQQDDLKKGWRSMVLKIYDESGNYIYYDICGEQYTRGFAMGYTLLPNMTYYIKVGEENPTTPRRGNFNYSFFIYKKPIKDGVGDTQKTAIPLKINKKVKRKGVWGKDIYKFDTRKDGNKYAYKCKSLVTADHFYAYVTEPDGTRHLNKNLDAIVGHSPGGSGIGAYGEVSIYRDSISDKNRVTTIMSGHVYYIVADCKCANYSIKIERKKVPITINKTKATLGVNSTLQLEMLYNRGKKVTWKSDNKKIATVSSKGKVKAKKIGKTTIYAKVAGKTYKCKVTVKKAHKHKWLDANCTNPKRCSLCGKTTGTALGHRWKKATCTSYEICTVCNTISGKISPHDAEWIVTKKATATKDGLKVYKCKICGTVLESEVIKKNAETPWKYYTGKDGKQHRTKTMWDGTVLNEEKVTIGNYSAWGWYDYEAASAMNKAVNYSLAQVDGWKPFTVSESYIEKAKLQAFAYAIKGSSSKAYHANFGGLPNMDNDKRGITLSDGYNVDNYIMCFVCDGYQQDGDYTYGQYWGSWFGTYYASGNF